MTRSDQTTSAYDDDFFTWTQDQAAALRAGRQAAIDVEHLAEEIEDLGKRDLREVKSFLRLVLTHLMKIDANPDASGVLHWRSETRSFSQAAAEALTPGMRQLIDVPALWNNAAANFQADVADLGLRPPRARSCPFTLDELLPAQFDIGRALEKMAPEGGDGRAAPAVNPTPARPGKRPR